MRQLKGSEIASIRSELAAQNENLCAVSGRPLVNPCLDHDHKTGRIRGVIERGINCIIGHMENNAVRNGIKIEDLPQLLRQIADYLELPQYDMLHPSVAPKEKKLKKRQWIMQVERACIKQKIKCPEYGTGRLTKEKEKIFRILGIEPEFLK